MRKIVICDDEPMACRKLCGYVDALEEETGAKFLKQCFGSGEELLENLPRDADILLLDIKMGELSGMEVSRLLREKNNDVCIIFITTMTQYALEGYEVHAFGFMKKPVAYEQFSRLLKDALRALDKRERFTITMRRGSVSVRIDAGSILYIESYGHDITVVTSEGVEKSGASLAEFEELLRGHGFSRCHKSYLVNLKYVTRIAQDCLFVSNGDELPLSKHRRKEFLESFAKQAGEWL